MPPVATAAAWGWPSTGSRCGPRFARAREHRCYRQVGERVPPIEVEGSAMAFRQFLRISLWVGAFALVGRMEAAAVLRFDTAEIVLNSAVSYDGSQGTPNPFTDVQLTAQV